MGKAPARPRANESTTRICHHEDCQHTPSPSSHPPRTTGPPSMAGHGRLRQHARSAAARFVPPLQLSAASARDPKSAPCHIRLHFPWCGPQNRGVNDQAMRFIVGVGRPAGLAVERAVITALPSGSRRICGASCPPRASVWWFPTPCSAVVSMRCCQFDLAACSGRARRAGRHLQKERPGESPGSASRRSPSPG